MQSLTPLFSSLLISSFLASTSMAQNGRWVDPTLGVPTLGSNSVNIVLDYDEYSVIKTEKDWIKVGLMSSLQDRLNQLGENTNLNNYIIRNILVQAKSYAGQGQVRLCEQTKNNFCNVISQSTLNGNPDIFDNFSAWGTYSLLVTGNSNEVINLNNPIDIELNGRIRLDSIMITLEPILQSGGNGGVYPTQPPIDYGFPPFLQGKNIFRNSGHPVQIGEKTKLEKGVLGSDDKVVFGNTNYVFEDFKWVNMTTLENNSVISSIKVNCLDERGYDQSFIARNTRGDVIKNLQFKKGKTLAFEVDRNCKYINSVTVIGYSPNLSGSRARIVVDLN